jgi:hypothetical protein
MHTTLSETPNTPPVKSSENLSQSVADVSVYVARQDTSNVRDRSSQTLFNASVTGAMRSEIVQRNAAPCDILRTAGSLGCV